MRHCIGRELVKVVGDVLVALGLDGLLEVNDGQLATVRGHQVGRASVAVLVVQPHLGAVDFRDRTEIPVGQGERHLVTLHGQPISPQGQRLALQNVLQCGVHPRADVGRLLLLPISLSLANTIGPFLERRLVLCAVEHGGDRRDVYVLVEFVKTSVWAVDSLELFVHIGRRPGDQMSHALISSPSTWVAMSILLRSALTIFSSTVPTAIRSM